jgi:hypothetical protein
MDEGESNSEPAESMILLSKDAEEKDPLSIALPETPSSDTQTKEDQDRENDQRSPSDVATPEDEADIPAQSSKTAGDDEKGDKKPVEIKNEKDSSGKDMKDVKDPELLSKLANMKQENSISLAADGDFQSKDSVSSSSSSSSSSMHIKKEPSEEESAANLSSSQQQTQPADLKVKIEIKSEKNGSSSSNSGGGSNNVPSDISNQMPNEQDNNNNAENLVCKPIEKLSALPAVGSSGSNSSSSEPPNKVTIIDERSSESAGTDYSMKTFMEQQQRDGIKIEQNSKSETQQNKSPESAQKSMAFGGVGMDREDGPPPGLLRHHPYEPLMKFDPMMKYELPHPAMDLKYLPPDHPARAYADGVALKSQFSADNLIKSSSHYPTDLKYQPGGAQSSEGREGPIDASRVTPNQDSQGSNSNSQPATLPSPSPLSSAPPTASVASLAVPPPSSLFVSHPGLMSGGPIPSNHLLAGIPPPPLSASGLVSTSSPFLPIPSGLHRPDPIQSTASRSFAGSITTTAAATSSSSISSAGSAFGPGGANSLYSRASETNGREGLHHRSSPLGPLLHGHGGHPLLSHPLPLHLTHPGLAGLPPHPAAHLPPHLHNHLMQPLGAGPNTPLPLIGGPQQPSTNPLSSLIEAAGRRTPTSSTIPSSINHIGQASQPPSHSAPPTSSSSLHNSSNAITSSANNALNASSLSRSSPLVHPTPSGAFTHRPQSPSSNHPANLSRNSPLHLGAGQPLGPSPAAISAERERHLMRQQSPHMTPPPPSSSAPSSLVASPLSKM